MSPHDPLLSVATVCYMAPKNGVAVRANYLNEPLRRVRWPNVHAIVRVEAVLPGEIVQLLVPSKQRINWISTR